MPRRDTHTEAFDQFLVRLLARIAIEVNACRLNSRIRDLVWEFDQPMAS